jgi:hypothetical protein
MNGFEFVINFFIVSDLMIQRFNNYFGFEKDLDKALVFIDERPFSTIKALIGEK